MKHILLFAFAIFTVITSTPPAYAARNEAPLGNVTGLHKDQYESGVQGSHFIVNEQYTHISNSMAKVIGIPEQYGLPDEQTSTSPESNSKQNTQLPRTLSSFKPQGMSFSEMSSQITPSSSAGQRTRIKLYNN